MSLLFEFEINFQLILCKYIGPYEAMPRSEFGASPHRAEQIHFLKTTKQCSIK